MMAIPMDNSKGNSSRERVQRLLDKNVELENKRRKAAQARIPSDPNAWNQMRENYETIILEDHVFSEQHDIEYALWQLHYRRIEELRALFNAALASAGSAASQSGKGPVRFGPERIAKIRTQFKSFLSEATGFYHELRMKITAKYGLPLGYISDDPDNQIPSSKGASGSSELKKGLRSCHRCFIYLGDLARYKGLYGEGDSKARDFSAASSYYMEASSFWPSSGNPHHQLAILAGYLNDELVSVYRYFRSLAVENPFVTARDNLIIAFEKNRQCYIQLLGDAKVTTVKSTPSKMAGKGRGKGDTRSSIKDSRIKLSSASKRTSNISELYQAFITRFVRLNGILFTRTSLETFAEVFSMTRNDLSELLSSGPGEEFNFGLDAAQCGLAIVRMIAILIFTLHNVNKESENLSYAEILQRSVVLKNAFTATFEFMICILERCNQLNDPSSSYLLPGIMVFVEWLACRHDVAFGSELEDQQLNARSLFWKKCIFLFNKLLSSGHGFVNDDADETCFNNMSKYDESETANRLALPEDSELRGFIPLLPSQIILDFSRKHSFGGEGGNKEKIARVHRIIAAGKALANIVRIGQDGVYFDLKLKKFVIGVEPQVSDDHLLTSPSDSSLEGGLLESSVGCQVDPLPNMEVVVEDEDEDEDEEVIVFKPSANEKHMEQLSKMTSVGNFGKNGFVNGNGFSVGHDSFLLQSTLNSSMRPPPTVPNVTYQSLSPVQPSMPNWSVEHAPVLNGFSHFNLTENGPSLKSELQDLSGVSQPATFSVPYPHFATGHSLPSQSPQVPMPPNFDSIMSSKEASNGPSLKSSVVMQQGLKKNPVSRPVRHFGPPPGFGSLPSKVVDESPNISFKNDTSSIPPVDDYSWLDGYHLSSSNQNSGYSNSFNQVGPTIPDASKSNGPMGLSDFPFPGKQFSTLQVQNENNKGWQEHQYSEYMKLYSEQQQQQPAGPPPPQLYQGQSPWEGRFYV